MKYKQDKRTCSDTEPHTLSHRYMLSAMNLRKVKGNLEVHTVAENKRGNKKWKSWEKWKKECLYPRAELQQISECNGFICSSC